MAIAWLIALSGMASLCLGQAKHFQQLWGRPPALLLCRTLRALGWLALAGAFAASVQAWGWAMGPIGWLGLVSLAGLLVAMGLPYGAKLRAGKA